MASPFSIFRRQEKKLLAVLAIMAMFAFTFVGFAGMSVQALLQLFGSGAPNPGAEVIAQTNWGDITQAEAAELQHRRAVANRFVYAAGLQAQNPMLGPDYFGPATEEDVINAMLIRRHARGLGMRIGDAAVSRFIDEVTRNPRTGEQGLTSKAFNDICKSMGISDRALYDMLGDELMVSQMVQAVRGGSYMRGGVAMMTPAQLWENYQKLNTSITLEIAAVPVSDFTAQVPDPSEDTLRSFFDAHKDELPDPSSPEPGFKQPRRIQVEYLMANFDRFLEGTQISEEQVRQYYEENKEKYRLPDNSPAEGNPSDADKKPTGEATNDSAGAATDTEKPGAASKETSETPAADTPQAEPKKAPESTNPPAEGETGKSASPAQEPSDKQQAAEKQESESPNDAEDVANQDSIDQQTGDEPAAKPEPAADEEPSPAASDSAKDSTTPASTPETPDQSKTPDAGKPAQESPAAPTEKPETATPSDAEAAGTAKAPSGEEPVASDKSPEPRFRPLDDVLALEIRDELRRKQASERIEQVLDTVSYNIMEEYASKLADWESRREAQQEEPQDNADQRLPEKPERPDLASVAEKYGLEYGITPLASRAEAAEIQGIGSAVDLRDSADQARSFVDVAFGDRPAFEPLIARDKSSNGYLYWKVAEKEEHVPTFDEVHDLVLASWKRKEARDTAKARAAELAQKTRDAGSSLEEALAGDPAVVVQTTPPFTWLMIPPQLGTMTFAENPPEPSSVEHVDRPGETFFATAFSLSQGEIGTAPNVPQTVWYVMRVRSRNDATREQFLREHFYGPAIGGFSLPSSYDYLAGRETERIMHRWLADLQQESGLKWVRPPDTFEDAVAQR